MPPTGKAIPPPKISDTYQTKASLAAQAAAVAKSNISDSNPAAVTTTTVSNGTSQSTIQTIANNNQSDKSANDTDLPLPPPPLNDQVC